MYENEMIDCRVCRGILPVNCLPFLGQKKESSRNGRLCFGENARAGDEAEGASVVREGARPRRRREGARAEPQHCGKMAPDMQGGREWGFPGDGRGARTYDFGTKVAAASAVVDRGRPKSEVMRDFGIASRSPLDSWCRAYREGGAEALRPRPKGRRPTPRRRLARRSSSARCAGSRPR